MEKNLRKNENETKALPVTLTESDKQAQNLQKEIERKTAELQKCLEDLERKKQISQNRSVFLNVLDELEKAEDDLCQEESFDTTLFKLKFCSYQGYRDDDVFTIGNREIIVEFVHFIRDKISNKVQELESKLIA